MKRLSGVLWLVVCTVAGGALRRHKPVGAEFGAGADCRGGWMPLANGGRLESRKRNGTRRCLDVVHDPRSSESGRRRKHSALGNIG